MTENSELRVLLVDSEPGDIELIRRELNRGFDVDLHRVGTIDAMVPALDRRAFDLVICDDQLPGFDAEAVCDILQQRRLDVPVIVVSGSIGQEQAVELVESGIRDYVFKNDLRRLIPAVRRELRDARIRRDLQRAEQAVHESEKRFRTVIDRSPMGILVHKDFRPLYVNPTLESMFALDSAAVADIGQLDIQQVIHPEDRQRALGYYLARLEGRPAPDQFELRCQRMDGAEIVCRAFVNTLNWDGELVILVALLDITRQRKLEHQLRQALKMEAIGQLTGGIAHDFNNVLTVVSGNLELVHRKLINVGDDTLIRQLERARDAAQRGADTTRRLLAFSRHRALEPTAVDVNETLRGLCDFLERILGGGIDLVTELAPDVHPVLCDANQFENAIINLAVNARDAMSGSGTLVIATANTAVDDAAADIDVPPGDYVAVTVSDTGCGISPQQREKIFEPFFTTKDAGAGTGLGLSMVYGFVRQSRGGVQLVSEVGRGTQLTLLFPRGDGPLKLQAAVPDDAIETGSETVLLVEDNAAVRDAVRAMLTTLGYRTLTARDARHALEMFERHPDIDLLITDIVMSGGMTGLDLAERLQQRRPALNIIYTSGYADQVLHHRKRPKNAVWLDKPFSLSSLSRKIRAVLDES